MEWGIHRRALGEAAHVRVFAVDVGDGANPAEQSAHALFAAGLVEDALDEGTHAFVALEVSLDVLLCLFLIDSQLGSKTERRYAVDDSEVHSLGAAAMLGGDQHRRNAKDFACGELMDIVFAAVGFDQQWIVGEMGQ